MGYHYFDTFQKNVAYPFGFGLSYTSFAYGKALVKDGKLVVPVTNTGGVDAQEVVQLYVRLKADTEGPLKSLRGFSRVHIPAGETVQVSFPLTDEVFLSWNEKSRDMVPTAGEWELLYGGDSANLEKMDYTRK